MNRLCVLICRNATRWTHRTPVKIYYPENDSNLEDGVIDVTPMKSEVLPMKQDIRKQKEAYFRKHKTSPATPNKMSSSIDLSKVDKLTYHPKGESVNLATFNNKNVNRKVDKSKLFKISTDNNELTYEKLSKNDPDIGKLLINLKSKKYRNKSDLMLLEGYRLIYDGLQADCQLHKLIFSNKKDFETLRLFMNSDVQAFKMPYKEMEQWSDLDTCPGLIGIFKKPIPNKIKLAPGHLPINLICDNVREPGNLGAILRSAMGVGCSSVLLTKGCTDLWNTKTLRSAAGAHFHIPIYNNMTWEDISMKTKDSAIFIADNNIFNVEEKDEPNQFMHSKRIAQLNKEDKVESDNETDSESEEDVTLSKEEIIQLCNEIPLIPYFGIDYSIFESVTVIIGGETHGISVDCYRFGQENAATRLNIPLMEGVDSLNVGMAFSVIAFEIKRQLLKSINEKQRITSNALN